MIGARASQRCELCRSESRHGQEASEQLRKKQWRTFKAKGVKLKRRASLGLTTGVGSIFSVPSPSMAREAKLNFEFKVLFVVEFKRKSHQRRDYRERGKSRAMAQHDILVRSLQKVAGDAKGENGGWKIKLIIFVGGTSG